MKLRRQYSFMGGRQAKSEVERTSPHTHHYAQQWSPEVLFQLPLAKEPSQGVTSPMQQEHLTGHTNFSSLTEISSALRDRIQEENTQGDVTWETIATIDDRCGCMQCALLQLTDAKGPWAKRDAFYSFIRARRYRTVNGSTQCIHRC